MRTFARRPRGGRDRRDGQRCRPGILAVCHRRDQRAIASAMVDAFDAAGVESRAYQTAISEGATLYRDDS